MSRTYSKQDKEDAILWFREHCPKGSTIFTILRHRASSGMSRHIGLIVIECPKAPAQGDLAVYHPNHAAGAILGARLNKDGDGLVISGCGMDMGFHVVYELADRIYGDGYALNHRWL